MHHNGSSSEPEETSFQQDHPSQLWDERDLLIWVAARFVHAMLKVSQERQKKKKNTDWLGLLWNFTTSTSDEDGKSSNNVRFERENASGISTTDAFLVADSSSTTPPLWSAASDGRFSLARLQDVVAAARLSLQVLRKHTGANLVAIHFAARNSTSIQKKKSREQTCIHIHALRNSAFCIFGPRQHRHRHFLQSQSLS